MRHKISILPLLGSAVIALSLYAILFTGARPFTNEEAEHVLSDMSVIFNTGIGQDNREARLQYSTIEIHGFAYDKWAHISNLALDFIYQQWQGGTRLGISTHAADLIPDHANPNRTAVRLSDALNLIVSSELLAIVTPSKPIIYGLTKKPSADVVKHQLSIPGNLSITTVEPKREMRLELTTPIHSEATIFPAQHKLQAQLSSGLARLINGSDSWSVNKADIHYDATQKSANVTESRGTLAIDQLNFSRGAQSATPLVATAVWQIRRQHNISGETDALELAIEHGLLTDGNSKISANGTMHFDIDDAPYGEIVIEITSPKDFVRSQWIAKDKQEQALALLDALVGEKTEAHKQAIINVTRAKNGTWSAGKLPLDQALREKIWSLLIFSESI